ncbi:MAG: hypothetical protein QG653_686 [Patescibacteria group bacterium]|nr:hypothetical protein [Patescibacteria group bacterium]
MSPYTNIVVGFFRKLGKVLSFSRRRRYELPYKHLEEKLGELQEKGGSEKVHNAQGTPKPHAKRPHLRIIGGKDFKK